MTERFDFAAYAAEVDHPAGAELLDDKVRSLTEHATSRRTVRLTPASTIEPRPVQWTWADRIPVGEVCLTPGRGGIGKSTFHCWLIAHLTRGTLSGVHHGAPARCIVAAAEDSWERTIVPRLLAADANLDLVYRADVVRDDGAEVSLTLPADVDGLAEQVEAYGVALVSLDPLMSVINGSLDTHKDRDVREALEPLSRLADRTGTTVLGNAHFTKATGSDPLSLVMGSAAFGNVVRAALGFARDEQSDDGACVLSQVKNNLGRLDLPSLNYTIAAATIDTDEGPAEVGRFVLGDEADRTVADILGSSRRHGEDEPERTERDEAKNLLRDLLSAGPVRAKAVQSSAKDAALSWATVRRAADDLGVRKVHPDIKGPWLWTLTLQGAHQDAQGAHTHAPEHLGHLVSTLDDGGTAEVNDTSAVAGSGCDALPATGDTSVTCDVAEVADVAVPPAGASPARRASSDTSTTKSPTFCLDCGDPLDPLLAEGGDTTHPGACTEERSDGGEAE